MPAQLLKSARAHRASVPACPGARVPGTSDHELVRQLRERTAELDALRADLRALTQSIAHDLRAPMTSLAGFAHLLEQDLAGQPGPGAHYARRIAGNVSRLEDLLGALAAWARLSDLPLQREPVDLGELAGQALAQLQGRQPQRPARLQLQPGLLAHGDARLLRQLMVQLVDNAWKFSRGCAGVHIEVGVHRGGDGTPVFHVRDRGEGFDMAHAGQLFGVFQRLHDGSEHAGTGMGLALVRKIVLRHGGSVWAESAPQQGTSVYFTLGG